MPAASTQRRPSSLDFCTPDAGARRPTDADLCSALAAGQAGSADLRREIERVRRGLDSVPAQRAEAFVLHDVLGFDLSEMAGILEISTAAAQSRLVRGRRDLHARIGAATAPG